MKMQIQIQKKQLSAAIALALTLTIAATLITCAPVAGAKITTYAWAWATPNPVGIGQTSLLAGGIIPPPLMGYPYDKVHPSWEYNYHNVTLTVTKPGGTTETKLFPDSDAVGTVTWNYICNEVGTWSVKLSWPGDSMHDPITSASYTWTVQQEQVTPLWSGLNPIPLPTGPWTWPVSAEAREWYQISGPWTIPSFKEGVKRDPDNRFNPYTTAPNTAHILWRKFMTTGGLLGGEHGWYAFPKPAAGAAGYPFDIVAAMGRIWYTRTTGTGSTLHPILVCLDQYTGETIYEKELPYNPTYPSTAMILGLEIVSNPKGKLESTGVEQTTLLPSVYSMWLVGPKGIWEVNPITGMTMNYVAPLPASFDPITLSPAGADIKHAVGLSNSSLYSFPNWGNPSQVPITNGNLTRWSCRTRTTMWTTNITWIGEELAGYGLTPGSSLGAMSLGVIEAEDLVIVSACSTGGYPINYKLYVFDSKTGKSLVNSTDTGVYSAAQGGQAGCIAKGNWVYPGMDVRIHAVSARTGKEVWVSDPGGKPWGAFATYGGMTAAYDNIYWGNHDGYIRCYDDMTGKQKWAYFCGNSSETAFGVYCPFGQLFVCGTNLYAFTGEHTGPNPMPMGNKMICIDALTGTFKWSLPMTTSNSISPGVCCSSGMLWAPNEYDGAVYMFGKGKTETTVSTQQDVIANGASVLIKGTVTDQSSGSKDTPAISDASMSAWMEYMYMNRPMPTNATGVTVFLQAMRSDGTVIDITHVTTDVMGHYEYAWTPPNTDTYKILATFEGSESYWASSAETALSVGAAAPTQPSIEELTSQLPTVTSTDIAIIVAVVVAIVIGALNLLATRKRK